MRELLQKYIDLQMIDTEFIRIQRSIKAGPVEEQDAKKVLDDAVKKLEESETHLKTEQMAADEKNLELNTQEDEIIKLKEKMNTVKNNKEYTIVKDAMNSVNARKEAIESIVLEHMEAVETIKPEVESNKKKVAEAEENLKSTQTKVAEQIAELKEKAKTLKEKRKIKTEPIDEDSLADYERTLRSSQGTAVAAVVNNVCQGCFRALSPNIATKVKSGRELINCRSCGRFLYNKADFEKTEE